MGCLFMAFFFLAFFGFLVMLGILLGPFVDLRLAQAFANAKVILPIGLAGFLILVSATFWGVSNLRRMSIPLDDLLNASNRVAEGDYSVRVEEKGPPEVRSLTKAFNSMAGKLEVNDSQRRNMLADVSHELRSPITIMQGNLEGMIDGVYTTDKERLKSLYDETQILSRLVDDLRTLALAESGTLRLKRESTDIGLLVREAISAFESQAKEKGIPIELTIDQAEDIEIDPQRVREVLSNLISNALRYTPGQGKIQIGVTGLSSPLRATSGGERGVLITIQDNGPGIEPGDLSRIFDRFYKSSDSGGMGLGLSIAKYLVEAHGGKIWADSKAGQGTKISFTLS
jgi:two-component system OmpR family sensor kinase/two-component system sensor histidine kinase BaeS